MSLPENIAGWLRGLFGGGGRMKRQRFRTMSGPMNVYEIVYDDGRIARVMNIRGTYQSATYLDDACYELVFGYHRAYNALFEADFPVRRVLMLGGGGFSYPKNLIANHPEVAVDVVEIDPMMVSVAERWFYLDRLMAEFDTDENGRLGIFIDDARAFLEDEGPTYDVIVNDCFDARIPVMSLATIEAARAIHARLNPGGMYLTNVISALRGSRAKLLHSVMNTLGREFKHITVISGAEGFPRLVDNFVVIASDADYAFAHAISVQPDLRCTPLVDAGIDAYEREFFLHDA